jgi:type IV pilus assembly protein PilW
MRVKKMRRLNRKGVTLIELLVALVICGMVAAGIYQVFIAQSKAYTVQDQVTEVQQSVRSAMEILLRDLRMAGYDNDNILSTITINNPIANLSDNAITVNYEYYDKTLAQYQKHTVVYWRDGGSSSLIRQLTVNDVATPQETLLENVENLNFTYGVDVNEDGALDNWVPAVSIGTSKVVAVRVALTARPVQINPDQKMISPRTLVSNVTLRNLCMIR